MSSSSKSLPVYRSRSEESGIWNKRRSRGSQREGERNLQEGGGETQELYGSSRVSSAEGRDGGLKQRSRGTVGPKVSKKEVGRIGGSGR